MPKKGDSKSVYEEIHVHNWYLTQADISQERCQGCSYLRVSDAEYSRRVLEWENYFVLVTETDSYRDFMSLKNKTGNVAEVVKRAQERMDRDEYMPKPSFPDPSTWKGYVIA